MQSPASAFSTPIPPARVPSNAAMDAKLALFESLKDKLGMGGNTLTSGIKQLANFLKRMTDAHGEAVVYAEDLGAKYVTMR